MHYFTCLTRGRSMVNRIAIRSGAQPVDIAECRAIDSARIKMTVKINSNHVSNDSCRTSAIWIGKLWLSRSSRLVCASELAAKLWARRPPFVTFMNGGLIPAPVLNSIELRLAGRSDACFGIIHAPPSVTVVIPLVEMPFERCDCRVPSRSVVVVSTSELRRERYWLEVPG
jgi:hypothetical protein